MAKKISDLKRGDTVMLGPAVVRGDVWFNGFYRITKIRDGKMWLKGVPGGPVPLTYAAYVGGEALQ